MHLSRTQFLLIVILSFLTSLGHAGTDVKAYFSRPTSFLDPDNRLEKVLAQYIDGALSGTDAFMTFYQLKSPRIIKSLIKAHQRGVKLHLVMDNVAREKGYEKALSKLEKKLPVDSITVCAKGGCINPDKNNHNKFYLFERVKVEGKEYSHVSIQTSGNMKKSQTYNFNDMLVFENRLDIYQAYYQYWLALGSQVPKLDFMSTVNGIYQAGDETQTKLYFSPSTTIDPYLEELRNFNCGDGEILLSQSYFIGERGRSLLEELERIKTFSPNCRIEALVRSDKAHNDMKDLMVTSRISFKIINRIKSLGVSIHSKMMLLKDGAGKTRIVTGSMNISDRSLRGDETVLAISDASLYAQYSDYWHFAQKNTTR